LEEERGRKGKGGEGIKGKGRGGEKGKACRGREGEFPITFLVTTLQDLIWLISWCNTG